MRPARTHRVGATVAVVAGVALALAGCTTSDPLAVSPTTPSSSHTSSSASTSPVSPSSPATPTSAPPTAASKLTVSQRAVCTVRTPATVESAISHGLRPQAHGGYFRARGLAGNLMLGAAGQEDRQLVTVDGTSGRVRDIATVPAGTVAVSMQGNADHYAWLVQPIDGYAPGWALYASPAGGGPARHVAGDLGAADGTVSYPVLVGHRLAWLASPQKSLGTATLHVADLTTGRVTTGATGRFASVTAWGDTLVIAEQVGTSAQFRAVDVGSLVARDLPKGLPTSAGIGYVTGSPERLVWSSADYKTLFAWQPATGSVVTYTLDGFDPHGFQFMQVTDHYMAWFASQSNSLMDLDSGVMFDLDISTNVVADNGRLGASHSARAGSQGRFGPARIVVRPAAEWFATSACGSSGAG